MTRAVPFKTIGVQRTREVEDARRRDQLPALLRFSELLQARKRPSAAARESDRGEQGAPERVETEPSLPPPAGAGAATPAAARQAFSHFSETFRCDAGSAASVQGGGVADAPAHPVVRYLGDTVAAFCNEPAVSDGEGWEVRMPLRQDVLPATTLQLVISAHWLQLRFEVHDVRSRDLICTHRDALALALERQLRRSREISITID